MGAAAFGQLLGDLRPNRLDCAHTTFQRGKQPSHLLKTHEMACEDRYRKARKEKAGSTLKFQGPCSSWLVEWDIFVAPYRIDTSLGPFSLALLEAHGSWR